MADPVATESTQGAFSETTPLLMPNVASTHAEPGEQPSDSGSADSADRTVPVVIATWVELITGVLSVFFGVACAIILSASPTGFHFPWVIKDMIPGVVFLVRSTLPNSGTVIASTAG